MTKKKNVLMERTSDNYFFNSCFVAFPSQDSVSVENPFFALWCVDLGSVQGALSLDLLLQGHLYNLPSLSRTGPGEKINRKISHGSR